MTDQNAATPAVDPNAPVVTPQVVYLKDCSFESPHGPFVGGLEGQPAVNLNISTRATALAQDLHEVVVQVHLEAKAGDAPPVHSIMAPNYLLSYARSTVSELVTKGGFPPFLLPLVTFEALHARAAQQAAAQQPSATSVN